MSWLEVLKNECDKRSIRDVAQQLSYSRTSISLALKGRYPGSTERIRTAVEQTFHVPMVQCPVLGEIKREVCVDHQAKPFSATSGLRVQLFHACKRCPYQCHNKELRHAATQ